jgi:hypothetical protein
MKSRLSTQLWHGSVPGARSPSNDCGIKQCGIGIFLSTIVPNVAMHSIVIVWYCVCIIRQYASPPFDLALPSKLQCNSE